MTVILSYKSDDLDTIHRASGSLFTKITAFESELVDATFTIQFTTPKIIIDYEDSIQITLIDGQSVNIPLQMQGDYNQQIIIFLQTIKEKINQQNIDFDYDQNVIYTNKVKFISNQLKALRVIGKKLSIILGAQNNKEYLFSNNKLQFEKSCYLYLHHQLNFQCKYVHTKDDRYLLSQIPYSFGTGQTVQISNTFQSTINPFHFCSGIKIDLLNQDFERIDLENNNYFLTIQFRDVDMNQKKERQAQEQQARQQRNQIVKQQKIDQMQKQLQFQEKILQELQKDRQVQKMIIKNIEMQEKVTQLDDDQQIEKMQQNYQLMKQQINLMKERNDKQEELQQQYSGDIWKYQNLQEQVKENQKIKDSMRNTVNYQTKKIKNEAEQIIDQGTGKNDNDIENKINNRLDKIEVVQRSKEEVDQETEELKEQMRVIQESLLKDEFIKQDIENRINEIRLIDDEIQKIDNQIDDE